MVFKKIIFQNRYVALETPSRPPPFMAKTILNFCFDYWNPSLRLATRWVEELPWLQQQHVQISSCLLQPVLLLILIVVQFISLLSSMIEMITLRLMIHHNSLSMVFILLTISIIAHNIAYYHKSHHHPFPPSLIADQIITITKFLLSFKRMEVSVSCQSRPVQC